MAEMRTKRPAKTELPQWAHLDAPRRLRRWRTTISKESQFMVALKIGIDSTKYNAFEHARRRPSLDVAAKIELVTEGYVLAVQWAQAMELDARRAGAA
jgi:DNA-binding XRE family transcriptional regulator